MLDALREAAPGDQPAEDASAGVLEGLRSAPVAEAEPEDTSADVLAGLSSAAPKDTDQPVFQLWSIFANDDERAEFFERARAGGMGYGDVKKDLLARLQAYFEPMRARRQDLAARPDDVEDILRTGAERAQALAAPVLAACREAAGFGRPS